MLIEAGPRVLAGFPDDLSAYAQRSLEKLGVEVMLGQPVTECSADGVVYGGKTLEARTLIWAAGVRASRAAEWLDAPADRADRLQVEPDLTVPGHPEIFAVGDTVDHQGPRRQSGARHRAGGQAAGTLCRGDHQGAAEGQTLPPFRYKHAGSLAQIGKRLAVIDFGRDQAARRHRVVDLGHRPHLLPDRLAQPPRRRPELALGLCCATSAPARLITQGSSKVTS